jgi:hypothetical protein
MTSPRSTETSSILLSLAEFKPNKYVCDIMSVSHLGGSDVMGIAGS